MPAALQYAVDTWNGTGSPTFLPTPGTENCYRCGINEEGDSEPDNRYVMGTVMIHEVGHCALGLDHVNREWDPETPGTYYNTSFTRSWDAGPGGISDGVDNIRGSKDDTHVAALGGPAQSVSWFRITDNNPVVIDSTVIDQFTYSRSTANLGTSGSTWGASANTKVAEALGHHSTAAVMFSNMNRHRMYRSVSADDLNMLKMARTGVNVTSNGGAGDDYKIELAIVSCADPHQIEVVYAPAPNLGECWAHVDYAIPGDNKALARVFKVVPDSRPGAPFPAKITIRISSSFMWETGVPLFSDGFETLDTIAWSSASP